MNGLFRVWLGLSLLFWGGVAAAERSDLSYSVLMDGPAPSGPVPESALAPPEGASGALHVFEGRLALLDESSAGEVRILADLNGIGAAHGRLPEVDLELVQEGEYLVPAQRGLVVTGDLAWDLIVEPGRVWSEDGDQGFSRASMPFHLVQQGRSCVHNGALTFLFDESRVSRVWYQVTQETCYPLKLDLWGLLQATYSPDAVDGAEDIRQQASDEMAARMPSAPLEQLAVDYPGMELSRLGLGITPESMTLYGVVIDGVNYVGGCETRYGVYPYCAEMRLPSYSTAKSLFAGVALMRLTGLYGSWVPDLLIADYLPEAAESPGDWSQVSFGDTLDMATGNHVSPGYMVDENGQKMWRFFAAPTRAEKLFEAFDWPNGGPPGGAWVYRTSDTFIVTAAMESFLRLQTGDAEADILDFVVDEVFRPLGLGPGAFTSLRTSDDGWHGQAVGGYGLFFIADDVAKLSTFLNVDRGAIGSTQILDPDELDAALHRSPDDPGPATGIWGFQYNNGFWGSYFPPNSVPGHPEDLWISRMVGWGGIVVSLLPNGATYYFFSDNHQYDYRQAVTEILRVIPAGHLPSPRRGGSRVGGRP